MESGGNIMSNIEPGKLFVGGLSWDTTKEKLTEHFSKYGSVEDCVIMKDQNTGNPRGFGFVQYKENDSVKDALAAGPHILDNKTIDPKLATAKGQTPAAANNTGQDHVQKKVFIGGLPANASEDDIKEVFLQFGSVTEVVLKVDKNTNKKRGFGFVAFDDMISAKKAIETHFITIGDKRVEIKPAEPRYQQSPQAGQVYAAMQQYHHPNSYPPSRNFSFQPTAGYFSQTAAAAQQYSGTASGQYPGYPTGYNSQQYASGYAATAATRYPASYEYPSAGLSAQQHSYPQDTNSYGAANPGSYPADAYSSATGYGYTDQSYHHHYDQSSAVASTAGYPRAAQTQQRGTVYNNFGTAR